MANAKANGVNGAHSKNSGNSDVKVAKTTVKSRKNKNSVDEEKESNGASNDGCEGKGINGSAADRGNSMVIVGKKTVDEGTFVKYNPLNT